MKHIENGHRLLVSSPHFLQLWVQMQCQVVAGQLITDINKHFLFSNRMDYLSKHADQLPCCSVNPNWESEKLNPTNPIWRILYEKYTKNMQTVVNINEKWFFHSVIEINQQEMPYNTFMKYRKNQYDWKKSNETILCWRYRVRLLHELWK